MRHCLRLDRLIYLKRVLAEAWYRILKKAIGLRKAASHLPASFQLNIIFYPRYKKSSEDFSLTVSFLANPIFSDEVRFRIIRLIPLLATRDDQTWNWDRLGWHRIYQCAYSRSYIESTTRRIQVQCVCFDINALMQNQMPKPNVEMDKLGSWRRPTLS